MEVTVMETADLPPSTVVSFHTGSVRRHVQLEKDKCVHLSSAAGAGPIRVDLMTQVGSHTFKIAPDKQVYDIPIAKGAGDVEAVHLQCRIRDTEASEKGKKDNAASPQRKLQTALMMRSYLDNHDVLRQMQELLQEMVTHRPDDPIEYMIRKLEEVSQENQGIELDPDVSTIVIQDDVPAKAVPPLPANLDAPEDAGQEETEEADGAADEAAAAEDSEEDEEDDTVDDSEMLPPPPAAVSKKRASVSAEAYGAYNQRQVYEPKIIPKDDSQKSRVLSVLKDCWMFRNFSGSDVNVIVDAMAEKNVAPGTKLIQQGELGDVMWVIEQGSLECFKTIDGAEKLVKTCYKHDVFGELALLYGVPRAATVISKDACVLWELDRDTFKAICFEAATRNEKADYEGFTHPASAAPPPDDKAKEEIQEEKDDDDAEDSGGEDTMPSPVRKAPARRAGVSAEAEQEGTSDWVPPVHEKTPEERSQLSEIFKTSHDSKLHMLFGLVNQDTFNKILDAMFKKDIAAGENVIEQGAVGDFFYIVKSGHFDILVKQGDSLKKVFEAERGFAFGELALLYNAPRTATITATMSSEVWCLDRTAFRNLVVRSSEAQFKQYVEFINGVDVFQVLHPNERAALAEVFEEETFEDDEAILEQGEKDDKMFILRSGNAVACIKGDQGEVEVMQYSKGDYFGEIALLLGEPRKASVYALGPVTCLYISRDTFIRILGPMTSILKRNIDRYAKYQDAITEADNTGEEVQHEDTEKADEEEHEGGMTQKVKGFKRKREKKQQDAGLTSLKAKTAEQLEKNDDAAGEESLSLADKVAKDFKNPALVNPTPSLQVPSSHFMMYGGLIAGQKFKDDKKIHFQGKAKSPNRQQEDDEYLFTSPTKLKALTEMAVLCQKGQKSESDPTPNQDNYFVHHVDNISMYGVADGHGPFGHLVSFRLVQSLPHFICNSKHFREDWAECLKEAFLAAQDDLVAFCNEHNINIEASGAAGSVLVLEEQTVHIAFIGDARVMLGSWNRRDTRMVFCSQDHKPQLPEEKARLEAAGSEVREIDPDTYRIYLPGQNFPGLTMSRAFGDTACNGVLREPEYHRFLMQPTDEWFCLVASDGIWEFMEGEEVCNMAAKKLRLKGPRETLQFLIGASRKRWAHCCGDYCDDITGILVQWNSKSKPADKDNHSLIVKRPTVQGEPYEES